jgi:hypothetical protein
MYFHEAYRHDLQSFSLPTMLSHERQPEMLQRLATEVIPAVRGAARTSLWTENDPYGGRPDAGSRPGRLPTHLCRRLIVNNRKPLPRGDAEVAVSGISDNGDVAGRGGVCGFNDKQTLRFQDGTSVFQ